MFCRAWPAKLVGKPAPKPAPDQAGSRDGTCVGRVLPAGLQGHGDLGIEVRGGRLGGRAGLGDARDRPLEVLVRLQRLVLQAIKDRVCEHSPPRRILGGCIRFRSVGWQRPLEGRGKRDASRGVARLRRGGRVEGSGPPQGTGQAEPGAGGRAGAGTWRRTRLHLTLTLTTRGEPGPQAVLEARHALAVEDDLHRDPLDDLGEVAGGIVSGKQRELGTGRRGDAVHLAGEDVAANRVDRDLDLLADRHAAQLGLLEVRGYPVVWVDEREHRLADLDTVANLDVLVANPAADGRRDG